MPELSPPTRARYVVLGFLASLVFVLYLDRICIAQAAPSIMAELDLSKSEMSYVFGAFTIAYGLFEVPTGRWGDRFGSRGVLTRIVLWWSAFTALTGCAFSFSWASSVGFSLWGWSWSLPLALNSFVFLLVVRFLFGAGEAGALPNVARIVDRWVPIYERGIARGIVLTSMQVGGATAPLVTAQLIHYVDWRMAFVIYGLLGLVWGGLFYWWFRDDPAQHPGVNESERRLLERSERNIPAGHEHPPIPWRWVLSSPNVWLLGTIMTASAFSSYMCMFWLPTYMIEARALSKDAAAGMQSLVLVGAACGALSGGWLSTQVVRWTGEGRWSRSLLGMTLLGVAAILLGSSVLCASPLHTALLVTAASVFGHAQVGNWWAATAEISGRHLGAMFGLLNSLGVPGAFGSQIFMGKFADYRQELGFKERDCWDPAFFVYAAVLMFGALCWLLVDATRSATDEPGRAARGA